MRKQCK